MEKFFDHFKTKEWLYVAGAFASLLALYMVYRGQGTALPSGTITDVPNTQSGDLPNYMSFNAVPWDAPVIPLPAGSDVAPDTTAGCCNECNNSDPLATGDAFSSVNQLLTYYQNTNPNYVALQAVQLQRYAALFASGESYSRGGTPLGVEAIGQSGN